MVLQLLKLLLLLLSLAATPGLAASSGSVHSQTNRRQLTGRFLHITDIHPDPYYKTNSSVGAACHHHKPSNDPERAGRLGTSVSDCDTPLSLVDHTFDWLEKEWAKEVDFVIWTGDNARHDLDSKVPRSLNEIYDLNRALAQRFKDIFEDHGVPVIPSLGNNDIYPHNIIRAGPNPITSEFAKIWSHFIPGEDYHTVTRGIYFSREVIDGELAVISLNTMYFFDNNKVVDGCPLRRAGSAPDPGTLQLEWLLVQLDRWRQRGIQVWLSGHVPPTQANWYPDCLQRFTEIVLSYQDTVLGQMYGHVNIDSFDYLDYRSLWSKSDTSKHNDRYSTLKFMHDDLYSSYAALPSAGQMKLEDFCIVHTGPSVIPTYLPSLRIWNYNVTHSEDRYKPQQESPKETIVPGRVFTNTKGLWNIWKVQTNEMINKGLDLVRKRKDLVRKRKKKKKGKKREPKRPIPRLPRHFSPNSPSRTNRYLSPLGYTQYYLPIDQHDQPSWTIEYMTYPPEAIVHLLPKHLLPNTSDNSHRQLEAPYKMSDLTIPSWLSLAKLFVDDKKLWKGYVRKMYVSSGAEARILAT